MPEMCALIFFFVSLEGEKKKTELNSNAYRCTLNEHKLFIEIRWYSFLFAVSEFAL